MNVLVIDDEDIVREVTIANLECSGLAKNVLEANSSKRAMELLDTVANIDLIICDYNMPEDNGDVVYNYLRSTLKSNIPFILFSSSNASEISLMEELSDDSLSMFLEKPMSLESFKQALEQFMFNFNRVTSSPLIYLRVKLLYLLRFGFSGVDLYISLSEKKYIKIINHDELLCENLINCLLGRGIKFLYIKKNTKYKVQSDISYFPFLYDKETDPINKNEKTRLILHSILTNLGISENSIKKTYDQISGLKMVVNKHKLKSQLEIFLSLNNSLYDHSFILAALCNEVTQYLSWHNSQTATKLSLAAILHDISYVSLEIDMNLSSKLSIMNDKKLDLDELENIKWLTQKSADIVFSCSKIDSQIAEMIEKHHENSKGTGFPKGLGARSVGPLTATFNIAHQIVQELYEHQYDERAVPKIMESIKGYYDEGNYQNSLKAFEEVFK